jgi:hypothetical protein
MAEPGWEVLPHPDGPEFANVRADLARLYIEHKVELQLTDWTDEQIVERVSDITAALIGCAHIALQRGDAAWLERHQWFGEACGRLFRNQAAIPLHS